MDSIFCASDVSFLLGVLEWYETFEVVWYLVQLL
jgi:hypothetical protein